MTPGYARRRSELPWLPYESLDRVIINAHNFTPAAFDPSVNGKTPICVWCPSRDDAGNGTTTLNDLIGTNDGTLTTMDAATDWVSDTGAGGIRALDFDGTNDHVIGQAGAHEASLDSNVFSVSLWCYVRSFSTFPVLWTVQRDGVANDGGLIEFGNVGSTLFVKSASDAVGTSGARTYTLSPAVALNTWSHIAFIKSGTGNNGSVYVNGVLQTSWSGSFGTTAIGSTHKVKIGVYQTSIAALNGRIDDYRLFDQALSSDDITHLAMSRGISA